MMTLYCIVLSKYGKMVRVFVLNLLMKKRCKLKENISVQPVKMFPLFNMYLSISVSHLYNKGLTQLHNDLYSN